MTDLVLLFSCQIADLLVFNAVRGQGKEPCPWSHGETQGREEGQGAGVSLALAFPVHRGCSGHGQPLCRAEQPLASVHQLLGASRAQLLQHKDVQAPPCPCLTCQVLSPFKANKCFLCTPWILQGWVMVQCVFGLQNSFKIFSSLPWLLQAVRSFGMAWGSGCRCPGLEDTVCHRLRFCWRQSGWPCKAPWV